MRYIVCFVHIVLLVIQLHFKLIHWKYIHHIRFLCISVTLNHVTFCIAFKELSLVMFDRASTHTNIDIPFQHSQCRFLFSRYNSMILCQVACGDFFLLFTIMIRKMCKITLTFLGNIGLSFVYLDSCPCICNNGCLKDRIYMFYFNVCHFVSK